MSQQTLELLDQSQEQIRPRLTHLFCGPCCYTQPWVVSYCRSKMKNPSSLRGFNGETSAEHCVVCVDLWTTHAKCPMCGTPANL